MKSKIIYLLVLCFVIPSLRETLSGQVSNPVTVGISYGNRRDQNTCIGPGLCGPGADDLASVSYIYGPDNIVSSFVLTLPCNAGNRAFPVGVTTWTNAVSVPWGNNPSFLIPNGAVFNISNNGLTLTAQNPSGITCTGCIATHRKAPKKK